MSRRLTTALSAAIFLWAAPAYADGVLNIYNWGDYTSPKLIEKFEKQYNVKVRLDAYDSNETMLSRCAPAIPATTSSCHPITRSGS
jgi:spermidine/putrescine transport system substrate-binding protein